MIGTGVVKRGRNAGSGKAGKGGMGTRKIRRERNVGKNDAMVRHGTPVRKEGGRMHQSKQMGGRRSGMTDTAVQGRDTVRAGIEAMRRHCVLVEAPSTTTPGSGTGQGGDGVVGWVTPRDGATVEKLLRSGARAHGRKSKNAPVVLVAPTRRGVVRLLPRRGA